MNLKRNILLDIYLSSILFSFIFFSSCTHDPVDSGMLDTVCFDSEIFPLLHLSCGTSGCHDSLTKAEGFAATDYASILALVTPGNPRKSELYKVITNINGENFMPPGNPLSLYERNLIQVWISQGALNTECLEVNCDTLNVISFANQVFPILQSNCTRCHNTPPGNGGILLNNYENIVSSAELMQNDTPILIGALRYLDGFAPMPPGGNQLDECSIRIIERWIDQGTPDN